MTANLGRPYSDVVELADESAATATGTGTAVAAPGGRIGAMQFIFDLTSAASTGSDTLDVYVETTLDGTNWIEIVHFAQVTGSATTYQMAGKIVAGLKEDLFTTSATLAASAHRDLFGSQYRAKWTITDDSGSASFAFTVNMLPC